VSHDADLDSARHDQACGIWAKQPSAALSSFVDKIERRLRRDVFGNQDDDGDSGRQCFPNGTRGSGGRDKNHGRLRIDPRNRFANGRKDGDSRDCFTAASRRHAGNYARTTLQEPHDLNAPLPTGDSLQDNAGMAIEQRERAPHVHERSFADAINDLMHAVIGSAPALRIPFAVNSACPSVAR